MRGSSARPLELLPETAANKKWGGGKSARIMVHIRYSLVHIRCFDLRVEPPTIHSYIQPKKILPWCFRCLGTMTRGFSPERSSIRIFQLEASFRTIGPSYVRSSFFLEDGSSLYETFYRSTIPLTSVTKTVLLYIIDVYFLSSFVLSMFIFLQDFTFERNPGRFCRKINIDKFPVQKVGISYTLFPPEDPHGADCPNLDTPTIRPSLSILHRGPSHCRTSELDSARKYRGSRTIPLPNVRT